MVEEWELKEAIRQKKVAYKKRERSSFFKSSFIWVNTVAGFTSCFLIVCKHHYTTSLCQWHPLFSVQSDWYAPPLVSSTSYSVAHALFLPLQNPMLFSKHHHYSFSKHAQVVFMFVPKYVVNDIGTNLWLVHAVVAVHICETRKNCQFGHILRTG